MADPWIDIPDVMADADNSLHAGMAKADQSNLERAYEQSGYDFFALRGRQPYGKTFSGIDLDQWQWLDELGTLPLPVSYGLYGVWNRLTISFESLRTGAGLMYARAYLLSSSGEPALDATDGVAGEQAYDEQPVSIVSGWQALAFDPIYPRLADARRGGGGLKAVGLAIPVVWLRVAVRTDTAQDVALRALRVVEVPE